MNKKDILTFRTKKLRKIINYAYEHSPAFKLRLDRLDLKPDEIRDVKDLEKIPVLRKDKLVDLQARNAPFGGHLAVDLHSLKRIFQSPGPIYDPQGTHEDYWRFAAPLKIAGFGKGDIVINTFSYHLSPAGFMFDDGLRAIGAVVVPAGVGNTELQVKIIAALKVTGYVGTPSFLATLLNKARELETEFPIEKAFVGAEPFTAPQRKLFGKAGVDVYQGYGTADVGAIAFECKEKKGMHVSADLIVEIVNPNTGHQLPANQIGEVVVTVFEETYPLIRFGTGDSSKLLSEDCICGLLTERIAGFMGRVGDAVKVRGMFIHPRQLAEIIASFSDLGEFLVEVTRENDRDFMNVKLEIDDINNSEEIVKGLEKKIKEVLRVKADRIEFVAKGTLKSENKIIDRRAWK